MKRGNFPLNGENLRAKREYFSLSDKINDRKPNFSLSLYTKFVKKSRNSNGSVNSRISIHFQGNEFSQFFQTIAACEINTLLFTSNARKEVREELFLLLSISRGNGVNNRLIGL